MRDRAYLQAQLEAENVRPFLRCIRLGEGTLDDDGYGRIVGGGQFTDFSHHPRQRVWIERYKVWSTAAGAYQFILPTWKRLLDQYGFPDFTPQCQDEGAVALIVQRQALRDVVAGRLLDAIEKCSIEWASLPGSQAGQRIEKYEDIKAVYLDAGGKIAGGV